MRESARRASEKLPAHRVSPEYTELSVARAWGLTPAHWRLQTQDDRARMIAQVHFESMHKGWIEDHLMTKHRSSPGRDEGPEHPLFSRMRQRMAN